MVAVDRQIQELARLLLPPNQYEGVPVKLLQGVVSKVRLGRLDVFLSGATFPVSGVRYLNSYTPLVGDLVWLLRAGTDMWAVGVLETKATQYADLAIEDWRVVGAAGEPTFQNGWVAFGAPVGDPAFALKSDEWVHLKGVAKSGTDNTAMFTLPDGYRPPFTFDMSTISNDASCDVTITSAGVVSKIAGGSNVYVSLDGLCFPTKQFWDKTHENWIRMQPENLWGWTESDANFPEMFVRPDGWVWMKGVARDGNDGNMFLLHPEARTRYSQYVVGSALGVARIDVRNNGHLLHSTGSNGPNVLGGLNWWSIKGLSMQEWNNVSFLNGWTNYTDDEQWQDVQYQKDAFGFVHLRGLAKGTSKTSNIVSTLPVGFRPSARCRFHALRFNASPPGVTGRVDVYSDGTVECVSAVADWHSVAGMFKAEG